MRLSPPATLRFRASFLAGWCLAAAACLAMAPAGIAATVSEYFNGYGTSSSLIGLNGGTGWNSAWSGNVNNYTQGAQVNYTATGYSSAGNEAGATDGAATGTGTGTISYRTFAGMTGTIWVSALVQQTANANDVLLWLDKTDVSTSGTSRDFVALRGSTQTSGVNSPPEPLIELNAALDGSNNTDYPINTPYLFLLRIDLQVDGENDRLQWWINPNLATGVGGLGAPIHDKVGGDFFGTTFDGLGISGGATGVGTFDALRVSNEADGFTFVTTGVPEPGISSLLLMGAMAGVLRRRRRL